MSVVTRFLFDQAFESPWPESDPAVAGAADALVASPADDAPVEPPPVYGEEDLARARAEGEAAGHARAAAEAARDTERRLAATLEGLTTHLAALADDGRCVETTAKRDALTVALALVRKLFPELNRRGAIDEIEGVVAAALALAVDKPRLVVRVAVDQSRPASARLADLAAASGWSGRLDVVADPSLVGSDCRADWDTGGATRDTAALWREIDTTVERYWADFDGEAAALNGGTPSPATILEHAVDERVP